MGSHSDCLSTCYLAYIPGECFKSRPVATQVRQRRGCLGGSIYSGLFYGSPSHVAQ